MSLLELNDISTGYGSFRALFDISLKIEEGEKHAIIGANGAGKSTLLRTICGLLRTENDKVRSTANPSGRCRPTSGWHLGISYVPEGRWVFPSLTVHENLLVGAHPAQGHLDRRQGLRALSRCCRGCVSARPSVSRAASSRPSPSAGG